MIAANQAVYGTDTPFEEGIRYFCQKINGSQAFLLIIAGALNPLRKIFGIHGQQGQNILSRIYLPISSAFILVALTTLKAVILAI